MTATRDQGGIVLEREEDLLVRALAYRRGLQRPRGDLVVGWAEAALVEGVDSPGLRTLAGLDAQDGFEIDRYLERALSELGRALPEPEDSLWIYARAIARKAAEGELPWPPVLSELYSFCVHLEYDDRLMPFLELGDDLDCLDWGEGPIHTGASSEAAIEALFLHTARRFAEGGEQAAPERGSEPRFSWWRSVLKALFPRT